MEQSTQPHAGTNGGAVAQVRRATTEDPRRMHPDSAACPPLRGYADGRDGRSVGFVGSRAFGDNDMPGPGAVEPQTPNANGRSGGPSDIDWFSVELVAGRSYAFHVSARATGDEALEDAAFGGFWLDPDGDGLEPQDMAGYRQLDGARRMYAVLTMTAARSGTFYFAAHARNRALRPADGGCLVEVYDRTGDTPAGERTNGVLDAAESDRETPCPAGTDCVEADGNVDWFRFDVQDGREDMVFQLFLEGAEGFDPKLAVHRLVESGDGTRAAVEIAAAASRGYGCLPRLVFIPGEAGTYFVEVRGGAAGAVSPGAGTYELHVVDTGAHGDPAGPDPADRLEDDEAPHPMFGLAGDGDMDVGAGDEPQGTPASAGWPAAAAAAAAAGSDRETATAWT